jgi:hypothetical protein
MTFPAALKNTVKPIRRNNLFRRAIVQTTQGQHWEQRPGEVVLYVHMPSTRASGWYFKAVNTERTPVFFEHGETEYHARVAFFVKFVERLLAGVPRPAARAAIWI